MKNLFFALLVLFLAACDAVPTGSEDNGPVDPQQLLLEINDQRRFITTDQVADLLVNQDPSLLLIDVREAAAFEEFSLPQSINIPLENLLDPEAQEQIECGKYRIVFYSYDDIHADQAWILQRNQGCKNLYVLKGGLNEWTQTIIQPEAPPQTAGSDAWDLYDFRIAARKYFTGGATELETLPYLPPIYKTQQPPKAIQLQPKKVVEEEEEGC
jgi:rhodanese-related sulfurtransferase